MTQDEIIEMARQAGMRLDKHNGGFVDASELKRLVKLVEDKTRRELREEIIYTWVPPHFVDLAVKDEREACANVCEAYQDPFAGKAMADEIRARSGDQK